MPRSTRGNIPLRPFGRPAAIARIVMLLLGTRQAVAESPPLWGRLTPGPHAVGFRSAWELDRGRTYNTTFGDKTRYAAEKAPRPILINLWYPAERPGDARPMPHGGYFEIAGDDPRLGRLAAELAAYARGVVRKELFDKPEAAMSGQERRHLDRLWATPTACIREAKPLARKGPLVVYHGGFGSSYEDNSVLCEFLASHGYVVIGSAFQEASGATFNIDGGEGSARDLAFLIGSASRLPYADWGHVAVAGHSGGAQAALIYASRGATPVDAVVSLDTTQDYSSLSDRRWKSFVPTVLESSRNLTMPVLLAANACAVFQLADALENSNRDYLTFKGLGHDDYISQGMLRRAVASWSDPDREAPRPAPGPGSPEASYEALCGYVLGFLDAHLRGDPSRQEALDARYRGTPIGGTLPHVEHVPAGVTAARPYNDAEGGPPEPRQVRAILAERGAAATVAILNLTLGADRDAPVFDSTFGYALVYELLEKGRASDAAAFYRLYITIHPEFRNRLVNMGKSYLGYGMKAQALDHFEKAATLEPDDAEAAELVRSLRGASEAPDRGSRPAGQSKGPS